MVKEINKMFFVPYDSYGQHDTDIYEIPREQYEKEHNNVNSFFYDRNGAYFDKYISALYYTQD